MKCSFEYFYRNKLLREVCSLQSSGILHRKMVTMSFLSNQLFKNKGHGLVLMFCFLIHGPFYSKVEVFLFVFQFGNNLGDVPLQMSEDFLSLRSPS